jgi:hypothetical protein
MADQNDGKIVKAGAKTYFFDLGKQRGQPYLTITEAALRVVKIVSGSVSLSFLIILENFWRQRKRWSRNLAAILQ